MTREHAQFLEAVQLQLRMILNVRQCVQIALEINLTMYESVQDAQAVEAEQVSCRGCGLDGHF